MSGAGNSHIHDSLIYYIEKNNIPKEKTLIVVMWSGYDRDDFVADKSAIQIKYRDRFNYSDQVGVIYTGGIVGSSSSVISLDNVKKLKSIPSRAIENFVKVAGLRAYLQAKNFDFVFTSFTGLPNQNFLDDQDYKDYKEIEKFFDVFPFLGDYSKNTLDGFHPDAESQHKWSQDVLVPYLKAKKLV
jgi:hypothetical protein